MKYEIIYADPPWKYQLFSDKPPCSRKSDEDYYEVMDLLDMAQLPIKDISDDNCVLFMWATFPAMQTAIKLMRSWGFHYRTVAFVWVKKNKNVDSNFMGMGGWTRSNAEVCLLGVKGNPKRLSKSVRQIIEAQVIEAKIGEHSVKPPETRDKILELMGDIPRIELFAREKTEGWDVWGNEVESDIIL
jgi:N6-adenosine-specific RNA methylase IME4